MEDLDTLPDASLRPALSEAQEDYLKQILLIQERRGKAGTKELAKRLHVKPASVTEMLGRLAHLGLVDHVRYQGVTLTASGRRVALEMLRHHRLLETFLVRQLGYSWDQVHEEAERLEHVISERFETRIAEAMGHPTHDPHGDPIPGVDLEMPTDTSWVRLDALGRGEQGELVRVGAQDQDSLKALRQQGVRIGVRVKVMGNRGTSIDLKLGRNREVLPIALARRLWVERTDT